MRMRREYLIAIITITASLSLEAQEPIKFDFEKYTYDGIVRQTYLGCQDPEEIQRTFAAFGGTIRASAAAALELRGCKLLESDTGVYIVGIGPSVKLSNNLRPVPGFWIAAGRLDRVWYPQQFVAHISPRLKPPPTEPPPEPRMVSDLDGVLPIGRWSMWANMNVAETATSNKGMPQNHRYWGFEEEPGLSEFFFLELDGDGMGSTIRFHGDQKVEGGFTFPRGGSAEIWSASYDFGWSWKAPQEDAAGYLILHAQRDYPYVVAEAHRDYVVMFRGELQRATSYRQEGIISVLPMSVLLVRIGSDLDARLLQFFGCVADNEGRKTFEVETCDSPFVDETGRALPRLGGGNPWSTLGTDNYRGSVE